MIVTILALLALGLLGASHSIIKKKPEAKELIAKLAPYQGWIGVVCAFWGAWWTINWVINIGLLSFAPVSMIIWLVCALTLLGLGLLFGVGTLKTFTSKKEVHEKLDQTVAKLSPYQEKLGFVSLILAVVYTIVMIV